MGFISRLKVATRLAWGFGITCAIGVLIGLAGLFEMNELAAHLEEISSEHMRRMELCSELSDNLNVVARSVRNYMLLAEDPRGREAELQQVAKLRGNNAELLVELDRLVKSPEGRAIFTPIPTLRAKYNQALDRVLALAKENRLQEATALLTGEVRAMQTELFTAVSALSARQQKLARGVSSEAHQDASRMAVVLSVLAVLMLLVGGAVGWAVTRSLRQALGAEPLEVNEAVGRMASGDLASAVAVRPGDTGSIMAAVQRMQASLSEIVGSVRLNSESVATASSQIAQGNQDLSQRTEEQAGALEQTAATMDELSSTVRTNADNAQQASQLARSAVDTAGRGGEVMGEVVRTMNGINDSSRKIADIIGVIDSIAFQTNILALNAAVEAARAGEQGRGFAVVASEVRGLAQRSAAAAKEIKELITGSVAQVTQGSDLVERAGKTMQDVIGGIARVNDIVAEISAASLEQSQGITQVGQAVSQMDQVTQQNAALVEESAAAASSLQAQAKQLVELVAVFRVGPSRTTALPAPQA